MSFPVSVGDVTDTNGTWKCMLDATGGRSARRCLRMCRIHWRHPLIGGFAHLAERQKSLGNPRFFPFVSAFFGKIVLFPLFQPFHQRANNVVSYWVHFFVLATGQLEQSFASMWRDLIENVAEMGLRAWIFSKRKEFV